MDNYTYYCEITIKREIEPGVYFFTTNDVYGTSGAYNRIATLSDRIWRQGPKGGIKIIKDRRWGNFGYISTNEDKMKEFMWAMLSAQKYISK